MKVFGVSLITIGAVYLAFYAGRKGMLKFIPTP